MFTVLTLRSKKTHSSFQTTEVCVGGRTKECFERVVVEFVHVTVQT